MPSKEPPQNIPTDVLAGHIPKPVQSAAPAQSPQSTAPGPSAGPVVDIAGLIAAHHASLYRYAYRLTGVAADAEDLSQQTFLIAQQKLHQLREAERAAGWLFAILRSCYLKWRRKRFPLTSTVADLEMGEVPQPVAELRAVDSEELQQVLGELHEDLRLILLMFYFEELSYKQIADELDVPIGTVMSRLSRAKQKLRERLSAAAESETKKARRKETVG
ncbi:MAG: RNA polymerase sigma factor [Pirellulaceae bacterium]